MTPTREILASTALSAGLAVSLAIGAPTAFADFAYQSTITPTAGESVEVAFPSGDYTKDEPLKIVLPNTLKTSVRLNGTNTTWLMPDRSEAYPTYPFWITQNGYDALYLKPATVCLTSSPLKFENFDVTSCFDKSKDTLSTVFKGGTYNFYDPNGTAPQTMPELYFDNKNGRNLQEVVFLGADMRFPRVLMTGTTAITNRTVLCGGTHFFPSDLKTGSSSTRCYETIITNRADVTITGEFCFNTSKASLLEVADSTVRLVAHQRYFGNTTYTPWLFRGWNSSLTFDGNWNINGFATKMGLSGRIALTNCTIDVKSTIGMNNEFFGEFSDCVITSKEFRVGNNNHTLGEKTRILLTGAKSHTYVNDDTTFGDKESTDIDFEIAGGRHEFVATKFQIGAGSGSVVNFTISGGTCERTAKTFPVGYAAGSVVTLNLTGGTLLTQQIFKNVDGATARLVANGGTFRTTADSGTIISGLDSATIGADGFTIDTNGKSVTVGQSFTGSGKLILTGGGTVTFAAGVTVAGGLEVKGGTKVVFNDTLAPASLTVGKDGTTCLLSLAYGQTLTVSGNLDVDQFKLEFTGGTYEKSADFREIIRVGGTLVGTTAEAWENATVTAGVSSEGALDASIVEDTAKDEHVLGFKVRDPITVTIAVPAEESVVTNRKIKVCAGDTLIFDIGADGSFASDYPVVAGATLVKRGEGTLTLGNANNNFASVTNEAGTIVLKHPNALGGLTVPVSGDGIVYDFEEPGATASTFTVAKAHSNEAIRVGIANADVTMPLYDILNGGIVKDGPGAVTFLMPDNNVRLSIVKATPWKGNKQYDAGFAIRQGEVAFRGRTPTIRELTYSFMSPKIGVLEDLGVENPVPPVLTFDHINFSGSAVTPAFAVNGLETSAGSAHLYATNRATVALNGITAGANISQSSPAKSYVTVDDASSISTSYRLTAYPDSGVLYFDVDHASALAFAGTDLRGNVDLTLRNNSLLAAPVTEKSNPLGVLQLNYGVAAHETVFRVESGSAFRVNYIGESNKEKTSLNSVCKLLFDDGEWQPMADAYTFEFVHITGELAVKGAGLVLAPTNTQVWTVGAPIVDSAEGAGGLVKRGAGRVVLDAANIKYTGVTRLEGGVLDLNGSTVEGLTVQSAGGALANGTLVRPTYKLEVTDAGQALVPATVDPSSVSGVVTIDLGRTAANPLTLPVASFTVATYTGDTAPDVSKWKVTGTGRADTISTLTVDPSTKKVSAAVSQLEGFFLFLQ